MASELRSRKAKASSPEPLEEQSTLPVSSNNTISTLDILRTLTLVFLTNCILSWFITKDGIFWGHRPRATHLDYWQDILRGPVHLTLEELQAYDGTDPKLPIYLAINGTIYDVSNGRKHYGPGSSYHVFAGTDASRGFVTGCFAEDRTPDMRGVETMYLPRDDPKVDKLYGSGELKSQKEQERRVARKKVEEGLKHWVDFFEGSKKYKNVGRVKFEKDWVEKLGPVRTLCERAEVGRPTRTPPPK